MNIASKKSPTKVRHTKKNASAQTAQTEKPMVGRQVVATLAYQFWVADGCKHGNDLKHWLRAEQEAHSELN
jgi:hypothetical protein